MRRRFSGVFVVALLTVILPSESLFADEAPEVRALWVDSFNPGLRSPEQIDTLVARAKSGNLNTIIAQVRRNAQSLYAISLEGWIENYDAVRPENFDPLQYLLNAAHAEGIEVHAWVNIGPTYSGNPTVKTTSWPCKVPCDANHIFNKHGWRPSGDPIPVEDYWMTKTHPSFTGGTIAPFLGERFSVGTAWFLDLGHPDAAEYTIEVLTHLLRTYDVDGIHLDYIRYPETSIVPRPPAPVNLSFAPGYNPTSVKRFNATYNRPVGSLPNPWDASWSQWRRDQVTAFVRRLYLEMGFIDPQAKLSAATIAIYRGPNPAEPRTFQQTEAYYRVYQDWGGWMKEGMIDMSIPMIYKVHTGAETRLQFRQWIEFTKNAQYNRHGVLGLAAYLNTLANTLVQIEEGRAPSASGARSQGFNFFSYDATRPGDENRGKPEEFLRALTVDGAYAVEAPFGEVVSIPSMTWKTDPRLGHLLAQIVTEEGEPADGALVTIRRMGAGPNDESIAQYADGNGYVGGVDLQPGAYQLLIEIPGLADRITVPEPVVPGRVTRLTVNLGAPARGPMARAERTLGEHERLDHLEGASELEEWQGREPVPEDLLPPPPPIEP
ncbi:MAG TPA: family 10 glycosylhydrolase [Thermoanaerobaculia bacterium]